MKFLTLLCTLAVVSSNLSAQSDPAEIKKAIENSYTEHENNNSTILKKLITDLKAIATLPVSQENKTKIDEAIGNIVLVNVPAIKNENDRYQKELLKQLDLQIASLSSTIEQLKEEVTSKQALIYELNAAQTDKTIKALVEAVNKQIDGVAKESEKANKLSLEKGELESKNALLESQLATALTARLEADKLASFYRGKVDEYKYKPYKIGLAAGATMLRKEYQYIVNGDSTASENVLGGGGGLVSAVLIIQPRRYFNKRQKKGSEGTSSKELVGDTSRLQIILNIPIVELGITGSSETLSSIFNRSVSLGIGLGYDLGNGFSVLGLLNLTRADRIAPETLKAKNERRLYTQEIGTVLPLDENKNTNVFVPYLVVGVGFKFGTK